MGEAFSTHPEVVFFNFLTTCTFWSGCALFHTALTDELKMKRLFSKCTVYTNASVSLLLAMWYLSSPGSSEPPASTLHCSFLCFETSRLPASSSSSSSCFWVTNFHSKCPCLLSSTNQLLPTNGYLLLTSAASGSSHSFCSHPCSWVE